MNGYAYLLQSGQNWQRAAIEEQKMWIAATEVIWHRSWQMFTGTMSAGEATQMLLEKPFAFARAAQEAGEAAVFCQDPGAVARAAVAPLHQQVQNNARRLRG